MVIKGLDSALASSGPLIWGPQLQRALGFNTYAAFYKAVAEKKLELHVFRLRGRRGYFARTEDVAAWLNQVSAHPISGGKAQPTLNPTTRKTPRIDERGGKEM